jgi:hypothetical protein
MHTMCVMKTYWEKVNSQDILLSSFPTKGDILILILKESFTALMMILSACITKIRCLLPIIFAIKIEGET